MGATTSAGLACLISGSSPEAVLTAADTALYRAKHDGRNRVAVSA
ncbi:diguanylate cyclase [Acinetobacter baumannii]